MTQSINIGDDHIISFYGWHPDREVNPHLAHRPDIDKLGLRIDHKDRQGEPCTLLVYLNVPGVEHFEENVSQIWDVKDWNSLTLSPSLVCKECGDHGYILENRWVDISALAACKICYGRIPKYSSDSVSNNYCDRCCIALSNIHEAFESLNWNWDFMKTSVQAVLDNRRVLEHEQ